MDLNAPFCQFQKKDGSFLAYHHHKIDQNSPCLVFLGGYRSDMTGTKASYLASLASQNKFSYLRFDYRGHGQSSGNFDELGIGDWLDDSLSIITALTHGPIILVGSSMGGWIGLLLAKLLRDRIKAFIGIAAAPDFTNWVWNHEMSHEARSLCQTQGYIETPDGDRFSLKLFEDGAQHLVLDKPLVLDCPVTLLHGKCDDVVPFTLAQKLAAHITSPHTPNLILIEDGDHRLARDEDLDILKQQVLKYSSL
jgi:pimeloyl-ACP methyl ester carboxylesterase